MYKHLLIPVILDGLHDGQSSFLAAKALASDGARFTILHVIEDIPGYVSNQIPAEVLASARAQTEKELRTLAKGLPGAKPELVHGHAGRSAGGFSLCNFSTTPVLFRPQTWYLAMLESVKLTVTPTATVACETLSLGFSPNGHFIGCCNT